MLKSFRTLEQAKKDRDILQRYIELIESYQPKTIEQHVIHEYALQGSLGKTSIYLNNQGLTYQNESFQPDVVRAILISTPSPQDVLHKEIRTLYLKKTRPARRKVMSMGSKLF